MATVLVVEDEALIASEIERALVRLGHTPVDAVDSSDEALAILAQQPVELVLMDINIEGDTDGIATALLVRRQFGLPVVFLTARSDVATLNRAKLARPYGYLTKPFTDDSLRACLELALFNAYEATPRQLAEKPAEPKETPAPPNFSVSRALFVRKGAAHVKVLVADMLYFEALQNYVRLHTANEVYIFDSTLKELEQNLPGCFFKTHRSHIVNIDHVAAYEDGAVLIGSDYVPVSRSYKDELKKRLHLVG
jgi:DNA-binding LytR/AlgR family response regulator